MAILTGSGLVKFAYYKLGTPYVYGAKFSQGKLTLIRVNFFAESYPKVYTASYIAKAKARVGKVCTDCSGLISGYTGKELGSAQLYSTARKRLPYANYRDFAPGTILWRSGHVGIFVGKESDGNYYCIEAKGIDYGTVKTKLTPSSGWKYGLTFDYITYDIAANIGAGVPSVKKANPYKEPTKLIKKGSKGEGVKWVQYELIEAGYGIPFKYGNKTYGAVTIDGDAGSITEAAICAFQQSCKITVDGKCGSDTRKCLKAN